MSPASSPRTSVARIPTSSWDRTSWPKVVVPSRWAALGADAPVTHGAGPTGRRGRRRAR